MKTRCTLEEQADLMDLTGRETVQRGIYPTGDLKRVYCSDDPSQPILELYTSKTGREWVSGDAVLIRNRETGLPYALGTVRIEDGKIGIESPWGPNTEDLRRDPAYGWANKRELIVRAKVMPALA